MSPPMLPASREGEPSVDADSLEQLEDGEALEQLVGPAEDVLGPVDISPQPAGTLEPAFVEPFPGQAAEPAPSQPDPGDLEPARPGSVVPASRERAIPPAHVHATPAPPRPEAGAMADHGATAPQLRRFIKSRAYVPMHELRRRFAINGGDDDVTAVEVERQRVYVGLPEREGRLLAELLRGGDIGVELSLDPIAPIVVGVYPIRPIPRT